MKHIGQKGFTLIEVIVSSLILTLIVMAVIQYHASSGASKGQQYYLKAVDTARAELEKLNAFKSLQPEASEFKETGPPPNEIFLFKFVDSTEIEVPSPIFRVYYDDHGYSNEFLRRMEGCNTVKEYRNCYITAFKVIGFLDTDTVDRKTFTYFTYNLGDTTTDFNTSQGQVDASIVVIDDMGTPGDPEDDLIGNIGWWVEDAVHYSGTTIFKNVTFALQFWYPGQDWTRFDPEVIVLKGTIPEL
ncbi:MAG: prepilin-type N-terminal cleavage/methylation domain-containing protein [Deltaproteobacteria bacterium]|nr:prepilin-type N-terminal cleavage/methylation domain-containing protein [Deltaproteobacteria bacterium]